MKKRWRTVAEFAYRHRSFVIMGGHLALFAFAYLTAFALRFDFALPPRMWRLLWITLPVLLLTKTLIFGYFNLYQGLWRYVSVFDLVDIIKAAVVSSLVFLAIAYMWPMAHGTPRSVVLTDMVLTIGAVGGTRFFVRILREAYRPERRGGETRVIIVGAGDAGAQTLREIRSNPRLGLRLVGFVDDDRRKHGRTIQGVKVLGSIDDLGRLATQLEVGEVLVAIPSATGVELRRIVERCEALNVRFKVLPAVGDLIAGKVSVHQFREVQIEDLLGREHVRLDVSKIGAEIAGRSVLITGAGGSIGSELARQVARFRPATLVLVDRSENGLFFIDRELQEETGVTQIVPVVGDIQDPLLVEETFQKWRPTLVYHAAAYKHVPLMEASTLEAVRNNVLATRLLIESALRWRVERFVLISTDKAVRPSSIMGASKRLAEMTLLMYAGTAPVTKLVAVRFGNVLGSEGSVLPIFRRQLARGGPLTVTHAEATRYFMTISEACQLILQSATMGQGGEIFILDMGQPIKIVDLARRLITLAGRKPDEDIQVVFTGLRPGERLHEELYSEEEPILPTQHQKIMMLAGTSLPRATLQGTLAELERLVSQREGDAARRLLLEIVSTPGTVAVLPTGS